MFIQFFQSLNLPIDMEDFVAWHVSKNGIFSVQIAYDGEWM
jgi:hypothetical protein